ncbi:MAG: hypothetical protein ACYDCQ_01610 [Dehalococcoidia bacterium]
MLTCVICRFEAVIDDVVLATASGQCVCLRCYCRETGSTRTMPKDLRRDLVAVLEMANAA